jgi:hypothetical protein
VTDVKDSPDGSFPLGVRGLIARLRLMGDRMKRHDFSVGDYWNVVDEAADALEAMENKVDYARAELAEERRKRLEVPDRIYGWTLAEIREAINFAEVRNTDGLIREKVISDLKFEAAREVAIRLFDRECGSGKPSEAESAVDAAIEAKMKEENR